MKSSPKGYSLHIGLNQVDAKSYNGWNDKLKSAENDAIALAKIAATRGFTNIRLLLGKQATKEALIKCIYEYIAILNSGDLFFMSFSGHGIKIPDKNNDETRKENDKKDEAWCLYNDILVDDEIKELLRAFKKKVRIIFLSDSCFSGSLISDFIPALTDFRRVKLTKFIKFKTTKKPEKKRKSKTSVQLIAIASSKGYQLSGGDKNHGRFTFNIISAFNSTNGSISYKKLFKKIKNKMPRQQKPVYIELKSKASSFEQSDIFKI